MGRIKALDPEVIHKIAAGEVIISPANALKELIENSIDAGATSVDVVVKQGGHKLLQITDNGAGIEEADLPILCQRFTTSKIEKFSDLETVATLGFRGEALASISHISHLMVKTKRADSKVAIQATFEAGKLTGTKKSAGVQGTQISVEDLFYNVPLRMQAFNSASSKSNEYSKILDIVSKYAIHYPGTFSCQKFQDNQSVVISGATRIEKIRKVYGQGVSRELLDINVDPEPEFGLLEVSGHVTGLNYAAKRSIPFIFFINNRLISFEPLSRAIRKLYQEYLPRGSSNPFVFLSIKIVGPNVDVNVHPTKREVHFLHETEIIDIICTKIRDKLTQTSEAREFRVQSYISATSIPSGGQHEVSLKTRENAASSPMVAGGVKPRYAYNLVRTDPQQPRITAFTSRGKPASMSQNAETDERSAEYEMDENEHDSDEAENEQESEYGGDDESEHDSGDENGKRFNTGSSNVRGASRETSASQQVNTQSSLQDVELESIQELRREVKVRASVKLLQLFSQHSFVGVVDPNRGLAAVQYDVRLYLIEYQDVSKELFYQIGLTQFRNFGTIHLGDGIPLNKLVELARVPSSAKLGQMLEMAPMLEEYFQISFKKKQEEWYLVQLPLMLPEYTPGLSRFPGFIADLATKIDWEHERECLDGVLQALASLHVPTSQTSKEEIATIFEAAKHSFVPSRALLPCVVEIASLHGLYKVFERC